MTSSEKYLKECIKNCKENIHPDVRVYVREYMVDRITWCVNNVDVCIFPIDIQYVAVD